MNEPAGASRRPVVILDGTIEDSSLLGGKGAALDRLVSWGLPVPPSAAVTTVAYRYLAARVDLAGLRASTASVDRWDEVVDRAFLDVPFDSDAAALIVETARQVAGGGRLAVRSSATVEDLTDFSFAGQYRSILDVDPADDAALFDAVRLVFASLWHSAPSAYRTAVGVGDDDVAMSVVLMQMVSARRAGVVFTVDPTDTGGAARVEAVAGLGEALVSGAETPRVWRFDADAATPGAPPEVLDALGVARLAEARFGRPQDVEWAWDGRQTWIVQARPITTIDESVDGDGFDDRPGRHDLTTMGIGEMLPGVLPPLLWELDSHIVEEAFRQVLDRLGISSADCLHSRHLLRRVRGRAALDFGRLQSMADAIPGVEVDEVEQQYFGSRRRGRRPAPAGGKERRRHHVVHDIRVAATGRRTAFDAEVVIEAVRELDGAPPQLDRVSDHELLRRRHALVDLGVRAMGAELGVAAAAAAAYRRVELMLLAHLGDDEAGRHVEAVTAGLMIDTPSPDASAAVFGGPTWRDLELDPPSRLSTHGPSSAEDSLDALVDALEATAGWSSDGIRGVVRRRTLTYAVTQARTQLERRERAKAALLRLGGDVRRTHDEIARRLCSRGALGEPADIELLTTAEIVAALHGDAPPSSQIARRRRWRAAYEREHPLPVRFTGVPEPSEVEASSSRRLEGWAASGGRFTGSGQVIGGPHEQIDPGSVLIAEATDASWSPLFIQAGAIVLERGGPLSHAAILARELGLPAVLNVAGATHTLDGCRLTVDGDAGVVLVHDTADETAPS